METLLEQQRSYHEERERCMDAMVKEILHKKLGVGRVLLLYRIKKFPYLITFHWCPNVIQRNLFIISAENCYKMSVP